MTHLSLRNCGPAVTRKAWQLATHKNTAEQMKYLRKRSGQNVLCLLRLLKLIYKRLKELNDLYLSANEIVVRFQTLRLLF